MRMYLSEEDYARYMNVCENNKNGLPDLEEYILAPMYGHKNRMEYYKAAIVTGRLNQIKVPTFAIHARDDWATDANFLPLDEVQRPGSNVLIALTEKGTHVTHLTGLFVPGQFHPNLFVNFLSFLEAKAK